MSTRVILADDHPILRQGLRALLDAQSDIEVVAEGADGREAVELVARLLPDVVILDVVMPGMNGIEAARQIATRFPEVRIVDLSAHADKRYVSQMLNAGASAYLSKLCDLTELVRALRAVLNHRRYLSLDVAETVMDDYLDLLATSPDPAQALLSGREREVLQLLAEGLSTKQIAAELHVSVKTIETHRVNIMRKLHLNSIAALTKFAISVGLTSPEL